MKYWFSFILLFCLSTELVAIDRLFGDDVTLHCSRPEGVRQDTALNWLHNNSVVDIANTRKYMFSASQATQLTIMDLTYTDAGEYTCRFVQDSEIFYSSEDTLLIVGTPVFSKCNTSSCEETHCVSSYNIQITLDLRIVYINSVSMTAGPDPNSISLSKVDNGVNTLIMTCRDLGSSRLPCDIFDNRFDFVGDFPHNISFVILSADSDTGGIYNATAPVTEPSGNSRTLIKTISVAARNCSNLEDPVDGTVSVMGCLASYTCNYGNSAELTRECQDSDLWSGTEPDCQQVTTTEPETDSTATTPTSASDQKLQTVAIVVPVVLVVVTVITCAILVIIIVTLVWMHGKRRVSMADVYIVPEQPESKSDMYTDQKVFGTDHKPLCPDLKVKCEATEETSGVGQGTIDTKNIWRESIIDCLPHELPIQTMPAPEVSI